MLKQLQDETERLKGLLNINAKELADLKTNRLKFKEQIEVFYSINSQGLTSQRKKSVNVAKSWRARYPGWNKIYQEFVDNVITCNNN